MYVNNSKVKNILENVKSKYILKQIFQNLHETALLKIIQYNKILQDKFGITIDNYIKHSKIEIELEIYNYTKIINLDGKNSSYFHIYYNGSQFESKETYSFEENGKPPSVKIVIDYEQNSLSELFKYCEGIKKIKFVKFYRKNIIDMTSLFYKCSGLEEVDFSHFNTEHVEKMSYMFLDCRGLTKLDLSNFNNKNLIDMSNMFSCCKSLKKLNLTKFNTQKVTTKFTLI